MGNRKLWHGLTAVFSFLLAIVIVGTVYCVQWEGVVSATLGVDNVEVVTPEGDDANTEYFKTEFGDGKFTRENQALLVQAGVEQSYNEVAEGSALLKNNGALPLADNERNITVFGNNATDMVYLSSGGGEGNKLVADNMAIFKDVMDDAGFHINPVLWDAYLNSGVHRNYSSADPTLDSVGEAPVSLYTDDVVKSFDDYNDAAIIVIARERGEGVDAPMHDYEGISNLAMHKDEMDMIRLVTSCGKFDKIIVLVNSTMQVELGWVDELDIDACLWIGTLGQWGALAIPDLLTGKVNPSGGLVDAWAANSLSAPACVNSGTETPQFTNLSEIGQLIPDQEQYYAYMSVQTEGIYIGYKYYETRYEDAILKQGQATDPVGAVSGSDAWNYAKEMCYPFGTGLSYTTFTQTLGEVTDNGDGTMSVPVTVKNTGSVAGKKAVLLYAQTPYGQYERDNKVEKSAIQLVQFDKTAMLYPASEADETHPNEQTLTLTVDKYLLASYDYTTAKTYILSEGDYYLALGENVHGALNNILAAKDAEGMYDEDGNPAEGDETLVYSWHEEFDKDTYATSSITGNTVTNRFDDCDLNYFFDEPVAVYLSRSDWKGTYPTHQTTVAATSEMIRIMKGDLYEKPADSPSMRDFTTGDISKGITLIKLRGKSFDDPLWDEYLSQYTVDELAAYIAEGYGTKPVAKFGVPRAVMLDGPLGVVTTLPFDQVKCTTWPGEPNLAATFNRDIIRRRGELMGEHCMWTKTQSINGPGCNLHRTPFNGRSSIYFSEDANLTYLVSQYEAYGYRSKGASAGAKHFVLNDQEFHRTGVAQFFTEQGLRETSLRAFENVLTGDHSYACMMSFNRIGCYSQNSCKATKDVARDEWGFVGFFQTDASQPYSKDNCTMLWSGTDLFTADAMGASTKAVIKQITENDDGTLYLCLKNAVKHAQYNVVNSNVMNGISINSQIVVHTPWWLAAEIAACVVFGIAALGSLVMAILIDTGKWDALKNKHRREKA